MNNLCKCAKPVIHTVMNRGPLFYSIRSRNTRERYYIQAKRNATAALANSSYFISILKKYYDCSVWSVSYDTVAEIMETLIHGSYITAQVTLYCGCCGNRIKSKWPIDASNIRKIAKSNPILNFKFCMAWSGLIYSDAIQSIERLIQIEQQARCNDLQQELCAFMPRDLIPAITLYIDWA